MVLTRSLSLTWTATNMLLSQFCRLRPSSIGIRSSQQEEVTEGQQSWVPSRGSRSVRTTRQSWRLGTAPTASTMESKVIDAIRSNPEQQLRQAELFLKSLTPYGSSESDRQIDRKIKYVGAFKAFVTDVLKKS